MKKTVILAAIIACAIVCAVVFLIAFIRTDSLFHGFMFAGAAGTAIAAIALMMEGDPYDYRYGA